MSSLREDVEELITCAAEIVRLSYESADYYRELGDPEKVAENLKRAEEYSARRDALIAYLNLRWWRRWFRWLFK